MESSFTTMVSIRDLEKWAVEKFKQCPKHITIIRHADREDDSQFHCVPMLTKDVSMVQRHEDRKSTRLNSSHIQKSRMPSSA